MQPRLLQKRQYQKINQPLALRSNKPLQKTSKECSRVLNNKSKTTASKSKRISKRKFARCRRKSALFKASLLQFKLKSKLLPQQHRQLQQQQQTTLQRFRWNPKQQPHHLEHARPSVKDPANQRQPGQKIFKQKILPRPRLTPPRPSRLPQMSPILDWTRGSQTHPSKGWMGAPNLLSLLR